MNVLNFVQETQKDFQNPDVARMVLQSESIWNNAACVGYAKLAMRAAGLPEKQIDVVLNTLTGMFDRYTVDEAEHID